MDVEIILYVQDQSRSRTFYSRLLNREPILDVEGMTEFRLNENCTLGLMPSDGIFRILGEKLPHPAKGLGIPRCELYLKVTNIEQEYKNAVAIGAMEISPVLNCDWGDRVGYLSDPDGHIIALASPIPKIAKT
jgi:predicted enzyme related to lactoylglutathione lyase